MLAHGTAFDILAYKLCEARSPEFRGNELASLKVAQMTSSFMVMASGKDGVMEGVLRGDVDATLVDQDVIIKLPVQEVRPEGSGDIFQG